MTEPGGNFYRNPVAPRKPVAPALKKGGAITAAIALILSSIYVAEGGFVDDPADRGGPTNFGVTQKVARQAGYTGHMRDFQKHCVGGVTVCADAIYVRDYIDKPGFRAVIEIDAAVGEELVDTGVNMGPAKPSRWFQEGIAALGGPVVAVDGKVGPGTVVAFQRLRQKRGPTSACLAMLDYLDRRQEARYRAIVAANRTQERFLKGWLRHRIGNVDRAKCKVAK